jgi:hypothetical protein
MDAFLADGLDTLNAADEQRIGSLMKEFDFSMRVNGFLFAEHAFRKSLADGGASPRSVISVSLFDVCSAIFASRTAEEVKESAESLRETVVELLADRDFVDAITYSTNSTRQVNTRFAMARDAIERVLG